MNNERSDCYRSVAHLFFRGAGILVCLVYSRLAGAPPPELPGEEITRDYIEAIIPLDSINARKPDTDTVSQGWLSRAMETWQAPPISRQIGGDKASIPIGKGAVFVPRMSEAGLEPDVEVMDSTGEILIRTAPGSLIPLLPGGYFILIGSGSRNQRIVRHASVRESKIEMIVPDWGGLSIDVVTSNSQPFRGEYELVRLDKFEPYGRGFGPDPDLGEEAPTWILKPGLYKIFGVGESYNTLRNFVTVQVLPGRFIDFLLVEKQDDYSIISGGIVHSSVQRSLTKYWKFGVDLGGSGIINVTNDRLLDTLTNSSNINFLLYGWLRYQRERLDWTTQLRLEEGFSFENLLSRLTVSQDDSRLTSLIIWRFLRWLGPYGRFELETELFPKVESRDTSQQYFVLLDCNTNGVTVDSSKNTIRTGHSFSPLILEAGGGVNTDIVNFRQIESRFRAGLGYTFTFEKEKYIEGDSLSVLAEATDATDSAFLSSILSQSRILTCVAPDPAHELGPEAALNVVIRVGQWAMIENELKFFSPLVPETRLTTPDVDLRTTLSWRLTRIINLDYEYRYELKQPETESLRRNESQHKIRLRFSFASR